MLIDFSTIGPGPTITFAQRLQARCGTSWVDAPVSGGATGAEQGKLVVFCGGSTRILKECLHFRAIGQRYTRMGDLAQDKHSNCAIN